MHDIDHYLRKLDGLGASELLLCSGRPPLYRAANELLPLPGEGAVEDEALRAALSVLASADEWDALGADRHVELVAELDGGRRVRAVCSQAGESLSARLCCVQALPESFAHLQLPAASAGWPEAEAGLLVVTGACASGKTTLVGSLLASVARRRPARIVTLERPIERKLSGGVAAIAQRQVGRHCASYAQGIDAALLADADVIACAGLDEEGAFERMVEAASSGVLAIGELPGRGAVASLEQLLACVSEGRRAQLCADLADCLLAVVSLDLLPRRGGGRVLAAEVFSHTANAASLLRDGRTSMLASLFDREPGMQSMDRALLDLATRGVIEGREAYARASDKRAFAAWA